MLAADAKTAQLERDQILADWNDSQKASDKEIQRLKRAQAAAEEALQDAIVAGEKMHAAVCLPLIGGPQGLGLVVEDSSRGATLVAEILDEGSASGTKMQKGDILLEVDGASVETISCKEVDKLFVGPLGKSLKLKMQPPDGKPFFADLVRQRGGSKDPHVRLPGLLLLSSEAVKAADKV